MTQEARLRRIRLLILGFIVGLALSGLTAFPLTWELNILVERFGQGDSGLATWLRTVQQGLTETDAKYPFIAYGTDWLAFGHLVIATAFIGPLKALVAGPIRGIPFGWRLIDCSFGVVGFFPLWFVFRDIRRLESDQQK